MEWSSCGMTDECAGTNSPIQNFTSGLKPRDWKLPHADSGQNSLEYWDYTVELEMLKGPEDLQLAAELGKTLLERNRELESTIKQQQSVIDDQTQEIEYLGKQTAALREVNDSRLRIYEQLEISIQDLEKNNQRLTAESGSDKRKIKKLSDTVEQLESKCDELQRALEEAKLIQQQQAQQRGRAMNRNSLLGEENHHRRSVSCENAKQIADDLLTEMNDMKVKYENLQVKLKIAHQEKMIEVQRREEIEIDLSCLSQENNVLQEQLSVLKEKQMNFKSFEDELTSLDDSTSSRFCRKCMGLVDETASNQTMQDFTDDIEEFETSYDSIHGDCALFRLKNGGYAWGSQESLASLGCVVKGSNASSPHSDAPEAPRNSLLSELDTQYRILIEKYESLLESREQQQKQQKQEDEPNKKSHAKECPQRLFDSGVDDVSGPMGFVIAEITRNPSASMRCQRCSTCTCDLKLTDPRPKCNFEEFSEVETSSSGFSEGESRSCCKFTQTERDDDTMNETSTLTFGAKCLDLTSPLNPCERRFQNMPIYKQLFQEIFDVLKKTVDENEAKMAFTRSVLQSHQLVSMTEMAKHVETYQNTFSKVEQRDNNEEKIEQDKMLDKKNKKKKERKITTLNESLASEASKTIDGHSSEEEIGGSTTKPARPDSLDLCHSSRSSSKHRRRRRPHRHRQEYDPGHQDDKKEEKKDSAAADSVPSASANDNNSTSKLASGNNRNSTTSVDTTKIVTMTRVDTKSGAKTSQTSSATEVGSKHTAEANVTTSVLSAKCEHRSRSRKHKKTRHPQIVNKHLSNVTTQSYSQSSQRQILLPCEQTKDAVKITHPSVEVARLRKLEMSYAEVLKTAIKKTSYRAQERRY